MRGRPEGRGGPAGTCKRGFITKAKGATREFIHDQTLLGGVAGRGSSLIQGHGKRGREERMDLAFRRKR